jgi:hypothetical protein
MKLTHFAVFGFWATFLSAENGPDFPSRPVGKCFSQFHSSLLLELHKILKD